MPGTARAGPRDGSRRAVARAGAPAAGRLAGWVAAPAAGHMAGRVAARIAALIAALRGCDWILLGTALALCLFGTVMIWSATAPTLLQQGASPRAFLLKQLLNLALGLVLMLAVAAMDARQIRRLAPVLYGASCLGLLAVLTPLGTIVNGARAWISLGGGFQIEPSEYAKLSVIVFSAAMLSRSWSRPGENRSVGNRPVGNRPVGYRPGGNRPGPRAVGLTMLLAGVPLVLVIAEPALGVTIVLVLIVAGMIALSGIRLRWLAGLAAAAVLGATAVIKLHLLKSYQVSRLTSFVNPAADPRGTGYSAEQARIAIGSGGLHGTGVFRSGLIAGGFVPNQHTDFIFAVIGNELGFSGSVALIGLLGLLLYRALRIAARAQEQFGMLVASGIAIWFAVQAFINIGMTVGIMPVTGLPLPFVSYGGSAMFADMIAIGLLLAVSRRRCMFKR